MPISPFKAIGRLFSRQEKEQIQDFDEDPLVLDRSILPHPGKLPRRNRMPYYSLGEQFIGRVAEGWRLHDNLMSVGTDGGHGVGVLLGPDGIGKTQLAVEYAFRFGRYYKGGIIWADAALGLSSMIMQIVEGTGVPIDTKRPEQDQIDELWDALNNQDAPVLLVLDNFPKGESFEKWLPPAGDIHLLVIAASGIHRQYSPVILDALSFEECASLINLGDRTFEGDELEALIDALGGLPLTVYLAGKLLNVRDNGQMQTLLKAVESSRDRATLDRFESNDQLKLSSGYEKAIFRVIEKSVLKTSKVADEVLKAMSLLAPAPVPRRLLSEILDISIGENGDDPLSEAIHELVEKRGLICLDGENADPFVHRMIAAFQQMRIDPSDDIYKRVVTAVRDEMRKIAEDKDAARACEELADITPHAESLQGLAWVTAEESVDLSSYLGWYFKRQGAFTLGMNYRRLALKQAEKAFEPGHFIIARSQSDLALALKDLGELEEAQKLLESSLAATEKDEKADRTVIAIRRSNLALVLHDLGDLKQAKEQHRLALAAATHAYEPGHPHIAKHQSNLALVLQELGELREAKGLLEKALDADIATFPEGHPIISRRQCNLALVLRDMKDLEASRELLETVIENDEKASDRDPQDVAVRQCTLALVLKDLREFDKARALAEKAYAASLETMGPEHQNTLIFKNFLESVAQ